MRHVLRPTTIALVSIWLAFSACAAAINGIRYGMSDHGPDEAQRALIAEEDGHYRHRGESAISGRVFLQTPAGEVVGAERPVHLTPATEYMKALVQSEVIDKDEMVDRRVEDVWWTTRAHRDGRFLFGELPDGDYLVLSQVAWSPDGGTTARESVAYALVRVRERQQIRDVIVTRRVEP